MCATHLLNKKEWLTTKSLEGMSCGAWEKGDRIPQGRAMAVYRCFLWLGIAWSKNFAGHLPRVGWFSPKEHLDPVKIEHNGYKHIHSIFIFWISFFASLTWVRVGMLPLPAVGSKDSSRDALLKVWWILVSVTGKGGLAYPPRITCTILEVFETRFSDWMMMFAPFFDPSKMSMIRIPSSG